MKNASTTMIISSFLALTCITSTSAVNAFESVEQPIAAYQSMISSQRLLTDIEMAGSRLFAVGERGHIIYSDQGFTWQQANVPVNVLLTAIKFIDDKVGFAVGHDATIIKTKDGGENWQVVNYQPALDMPLLNINVNGDLIVAVGAYGLFWQSMDGGETWQESFREDLLLVDDREYLLEIKENEPEVYDQEKRFLLPHFNAIKFGTKRWYITGEGGFFAVSEDQGQNWRRIETNYYGSYFDVLELSSDEVVLAGLRGNAFLFNLDSKDWRKIPVPVPATINNLSKIENKIVMTANSGNLFIYHLDKEQLQHEIFADGKAILASSMLGDNLVLATEAGIKSFALNKKAQ